MILSALPVDFPASIVIVQHLSPNYQSMMAQLLSRNSALQIKEAAEGDPLQIGHVYLAPSGHHLIVNRDQTLSLTLTPQVHFSRPSGDVLFASVATCFGKRAIGVILTGGDGDGAAGIAQIKQAGGRTIAQNEATSQHFSMPFNAIKTGCVDMILPLDEIAAALQTLL